MSGLRSGFKTSVGGPLRLKYHAASTKELELWIPRALSAGLFARSRLVGTVLSAEPRSTTAAKEECCELRNANRKLQEECAQLRNANRKLQEMKTIYIL